MQVKQSVQFGQRSHLNSLKSHPPAESGMTQEMWDSLPAGYRVSIALSAVNDNKAARRRQERATALQQKATTLQTNRFAEAAGGRRAEVLRLTFELGIVRFAQFLHKIRSLGK